MAQLMGRKSTGAGGAGAAPRADATLLVGLKGVGSEESGLPSREEIEGWWVEGMNEGWEWHARRKEGGSGGGSAGTVGGGEVAVKRKWTTPIKDME